MGGSGVVRGGRGISGRIVGRLGIALLAGERKNLRANDRGWTMHLAEMRQRKLEARRSVHWRARFEAEGRGGTGAESKEKSPCHVARMSQTSLRPVAGEIMQETMRLHAL